MRALSPHRRLSVTKNTYYPSVAQERRPSELGLASHANMKSMSQDLDTNKTRLEKMHMKSLSGLENQRKVLEKSMLAYTEKMKELMNDRTNNIFRGLQIRVISNGEKMGPRSLPASMDLNDASSVPVDSAKLRRRRIHVRKQGVMTDRPTIKTPIEEERENDSKQSTRSGKLIRSTSADILRKRQKMRFANEASGRDVRYSSPDVLSAATLNGTVNIIETKVPVSNDDITENSRVNVTVVQRDSANDSNANMSYPTKVVEIMTKPKIHVVTEDKDEQSKITLDREATFCESIRDDSSDSAYSSCISDDDSRAESADRLETDDENTKETDGKAKHSVRFVEPNPEDGYLLTVPKVHKRKRKSRAKNGDLSSKNKKETLLKKAILKQATSKS